jgi:restriction system protein
MPIPDFQTLMLPFLKAVKDEKEYYYKDVAETLSLEFNLTEEEKLELLPSGNMYIFENRVGWARMYLKKAGLLEVPKRAYVKITLRGLEVLKENPDKINTKFLKKFPEYLEFIKPNRTDNSDEEKEEIIDSQTPEEKLEKSYHQIRYSLATDILEKVIGLTSSRFEKLVVDLLVKMGYGGTVKDAGKAIGKSGDEGIDGIIKEDKLGLDIIYIQAKKWKPGNIIGRPELHKFVGALAGQGAKKGIFISTSSFTKDAIDYQPKNETKIVLIDGEQLAQLMIDHNLGVSIANTYEIKKLDNDYFE